MQPFISSGASNDDYVNLVISKDAAIFFRIQGVEDSSEMQRNIKKYEKALPLEILTCLCAANGQFKVN